MVRIFINKKLYSYERIVFPKGEESSKADILRYMRYYDESQFKSSKKDMIYTPVNDLTLDYEDIFKGYESKVRNEVRRGYKEGTQCRMI